MRRWAGVAQAALLLTVASLSVYTVVTIQRVGQNVTDAVTELRRRQVSELSYTWQSGGNPITVKSVQREKETYSELLERFADELNEAMQKFPEDT